MLYDINIIALIVAVLCTVAFVNVWYSPQLFARFLFKNHVVGGGEEDSRTLSRALLIHAMTYIALFMLSVHAWHYFDFHVVADMFTFITYSAIYGVLIMGTALAWHGASRVSFLVHASSCLVCVFGGMSIIMFWPW